MTVSPGTGGTAPIQSGRSAATAGWLRRWRQGLLSSARFQRWAAAMPFTRPIAQRKAAELFGLCTGFVHSQVLLACVELDLITRAGRAPVSVESVAALGDLPLAGADRLLRAAAALDLLHALPDGRYALGDLGASLLGNRSVFAMIRHHGALYKDLAEPLALLRQRSPDTRLAQYWRYGQAERPADAARGEVTAYSDLMAETQAFIADHVLSAYSMDRHRRIMDVGGGNGAFLEAVGGRYPHLKRTLCDLPAVADLAADRFAGLPPERAVDVVGLDAMADPLPGDADLVTLVRILHDHDDGPVRSLLGNIRRALAPGGTLLVAEPMAGTRGAEAMGESYFGFYLWAMGSGRPRTAKELKAMLREAGFSHIREAKTHHPLLVRCLVAR